MITRYKTFMLSIIFVLWGLFASSSLSAKNRVALVIGNNDYQQAPLKNPVNDARAIGKLLSGMGFSVVNAYNADRMAMEQVIDKFGAQAEKAEIALVYYAGHAIQVDGVNYLIPANAPVSNRRDLRKLIQLDDIVQEAQHAQGLGIVMLDACRDNPFSRNLTQNLGRSIGGRGLARVEDTPSNILIGFATKENATAADGKGKHSPYAQALLQYLPQTNLEIRLLFGKVYDAVQKTTGNNQEPYTYGAVGGKEWFLAASANDEKDEETVQPIEYTIDQSNSTVSVNKPNVQPIEHTIDQSINDTISLNKQNTKPIGKRIGHYIDHGNGTISDTKTGLMWKKCSEGQHGNTCKEKAKKYTWKEAMQRFKNIHFAGYQDWRMPSKKELLSLVYCSNGKPPKEAWKTSCSLDGSYKDYTRPTIDQRIFPETQPWWYWSSSSHANNSNVALNVYFNHGYDHWGSKYGRFYVRLVRSGQ